MFFLRWALCATGQPTLLQHADAIDAAIGQIDLELDTHVEPFRTAIEILGFIPGISDLSAEDQGQLSSGPIPTPPVGLSAPGNPGLRALSKPSP